jgi:predicted MFS family arabinose efflux permease
MDTPSRQNAWGARFSQRREWLAVGSSAAGTFLLVTIAFLPIGILSLLAKDLGVSEGAAGLAVTTLGLIAASAVPAQVLIAGAIDRRTLITLLTTVVVVSSVLSALAPNFIFFLIGRLILGLAVGILWSCTVSVGRGLVSPEAGGRATSIISAGISAGTIFGMPVGSVLGRWVSRRDTFATNAMMGIFIVLLQLRVLPAFPFETQITCRRLFAFSKVPMALAGYATVGIIGGFTSERMAVCNVHKTLIGISVVQRLSILAPISLKGTIIGAVAMVMGGDSLLARLRFLYRCGCTTPSPSCTRLVPH